MSQDGSWIEPVTRKVVAPLPIELQVVLQHELEFHFNADGHVSKVICSCGKEGTVEML